MKDLLALFHGKTSSKSSSSSSQQQQQQQQADHPVTGEARAFQSEKRSLPPIADRNSKAGASTPTVLESGSGNGGSGSSGGTRSRKSSTPASTTTATTTASSSTGVVNSATSTSATSKTAIASTTIANSTTTSTTSTATATATATDSRRQSDPTATHGILKNIQRRRDSSVGTPSLLLGKSNPIHEEKGNHEAPTMTTLKAAVRDGKNDPRFVFKKDNYRFVKTLGSGTYATVKEAVWIPSGEHVAVKIINKTRVKNHLESLKTEIDILTKIHHPNLLQLLDWGFGKENIYLATEM